MDYGCICIQLEIMATTENNIIGLNIKKTRERLGYTQDDLANYLGVSRPTINYIETACRFDRLERLSELLNMDLAGLLEEDENAQRLNCAFPFRANKLIYKDLKSTTDFQLMVKNYMKIKNITND